MPRNNQTINATSVTRVFLVEDNSQENFATLENSITASDTGFDILPKSGFESPFGMRIFKIENELLVGYIDGRTFNVSNSWRGLYESGANSHTSGTAIKLATLFDIIGTNVFISRTPQDYQNKTPSVVITRIGGVVRSASRSVSARLQFTVYGGENLEGEFDETLSDIVFSALEDRAEQANNEKTIAGILGSIELELGQQLIEDAMRPEWPIVLSFGTVNAV